MRFWLFSCIAPQIKIVKKFRYWMQIRGKAVKWKIFGKLKLSEYYTREVVKIRKYLRKFAFSSAWR